jgi:hypothetical protein
MARLYGEYVWGYVVAIMRAPLTISERLRCLGEVSWWALGHLRPGGARRVLESSFDPAVQDRARQSIAEKRETRFRLALPGRRNQEARLKDLSSKSRPL